MTDRVDSSNRRLDSLLQLAVTLSLAAPVGIASLINDPNFESIYAGGAAAAFVVFLAIGFVARSVLGEGGVVLLDPSTHYNEWLDLTEAEFKIRSVYWAGQHFDRNATTVWNKAWASYLMMAAFLIEIALIIAWVAIDANPG